MKELLDYLLQNCDAIDGYIQSNMPGISMVKPEGTYLAWLDCRRLSLPADAGDYFLKHGRVALNDGKIYGKEGEGFVRLNFGCPRSMLMEALERMKNSISNS